jgi:hypothetical protein
VSTSVYRLASLAISVAVAAALIVSGLFVPRASGAGSHALCAQPIGGGALGAAGISTGQSLTRYDGLEVEITPQIAPGGLFGCESVRAVVYLGPADRYVSLEIGAKAGQAGYRPAAYWITGGTGHLAPATLPGLPWAPGARHTLRILHVGTTKWLLVIDQHPLGTVAIGGSSHGLPYARVFVVTTNYDHGANLAKFKFTRLRGLRAGAAQWGPLASTHLYTSGTGYHATALSRGAFAVTNN